MKKSASLWNSKVWYAISTMLLVFILTLCIGTFARADETVKVIVKGANIRKDATTTSDIVGNVKQDAVLTILEQKNGDDGKVWYKIQVDANTYGYIRSDLVEAIATTTPTPNNGNGNTNIDTTGVTEVQPVGGTVKGAETVRVRSSANTANNDNVVASVKKGTVVTVKGTLNAANGKVWYQINYVENNKEVNGFIRSDYVDLAGELQAPVIEDPVDPVDPVDTPEPEKDPKPETNEKYEVWFDNNDAKWILVDNELSKSWEIEQIFYAATKNGELYQAEQKKTGSQKITIIILIVLLLGMVGVLAFLIYKMREMAEAAYIDQVEKETIRKRTAERPQTGAGNQKPQGARPQGTRPQGAPGQGAKPQGTRPQGAPGQGAKPQGARPQGAPATHPQNPQGTVNHQPQAAPVTPAEHVQKTQETVAPQPQKTQEPAVVPVQKPQETVKTINPVESSEVTHTVKPEVTPVQPKAEVKPEINRKPKNFVRDDDEFEFEFLNWNGDDDK